MNIINFDSTKQYDEFIRKHDGAIEDRMLTPIPIPENNKVIFELMFELKKGYIYDETTQKIKNILDYC